MEVVVEACVFVLAILLARQGAILPEHIGELRAWRFLHGPKNEAREKQVFVGLGGHCREVNLAFNAY